MSIFEKLRFPRKPAVEQTSQSPSADQGDPGVSEEIKFDSLAVGEALKMVTENGHTYFLEKKEDGYHFKDKVVTPFSAGLKLGDQFTYYYGNDENKIRRGNTSKVSGLEIIPAPSGPTELD